MANRLLRVLLLLAFLSLAVGVRGQEEGGVLAVTVTPAAAGKQVVRTSLPLPRGLLRDGEKLIADDGRRKLETAVRILSWHPVKAGEAKSVRRAMVTFPYTFETLKPVPFVMRSATAKTKHTSQ